MLDKARIAANAAKRQQSEASGAGEEIELSQSESLVDAGGAGACVY